MKEKHVSLIPSLWTTRRNPFFKAAPMMMGLLLIGNPLSAFAELTNNSVQMTAQQTVTIKGKVVDAEGEALIGVNLIEVGTNNGTITDIDGNFVLNVSANATLKVTYTGYKDVSVSVRGKKVLNIIMHEDTQALDEVVVIGYGAVRKADVAGSVSVLDSKSFKDQPIRHTSEALQGRVAGVQVESSGLPGGQVKIRVRGSNSINKSNDPLYVVDGIIRESGLDGISPEDIQSMQVLKDASSTAIYGARGSNGVILITTKGGKKGATQITLDASLSVTGASKTAELMNPYDYANALTDVKGTVFSQADLDAYKNGTKGIDWQDEIIANALTQDYKLAFSGGSEKSQFYFSLNYMDQEGLVLNTDHTRYQAKMNITSQLTKWLHLTADLNASHTKSHGANLTASKDNIFFMANNYSPTMDMFDENGRYARDPYNQIAPNPVGIQTANKREAVNNMVNGHFDLRFNICKGLTFTTTNGFDYYDGKNYDFTSTLAGPSNSMGNSDNSRMSLQTTNNFTYVGEWNKHHLTATAVWEAASSESRSIGITGKELQLESVEWYNVGLAAKREASNSFSDWGLMSAVARVMYNYGDRYLLTGTLRADGSSRFLNDKWGVFPSIAAAWTISNEKFMQNATKVNDLKLRVSYGVVGNQAIAPYSTLGLMSQNNFDFGTNSAYPGYWSTVLPSPDLSWEKTNQVDVGIDLSVLDRRLNIGLDYFYKKTTDALLNKPIPVYKGGGSVLVNDGEIMNTGVDFNITGHIFQGEGFNWTTSLNGTFLKNKVLKLAGGPEEIITGKSPAAGMIDYASVIKEGEAIGSLYGFVWDGLDENGVDKYVDFNKNGKLDTEDRQIIGQANPDFTLGWNNSFSYKNWDFNLFFTGAFGAQRLNLGNYVMSTMTGDSRFVTNPDAYFEGFDKMGPGAFYATLKGASNHQGASSKWIENADYFRLDNLSIAYTFPKSMTKFADVRLSVSAQNLFTLTGYSGMDPAGSSFSTGSVDNDGGIDIGAYPCPRTFTFGVRFNF